MIFLNFLLLTAMILFFAYMTGDINTFINLDSIVIVLIGFIFSSLAISRGRFQLFFKE